ncbi:MAG: glutamine synthetase family protein [Chloroflexota bacterium]
MSTEELLQHLESDNIEHFWPIFHDYNGRACAKTVPKKRFPSTIQNGLIFARANLNFTTDDHQAHGARFLADSGDFMAVPDPSSYVKLPYRENAAQAHVFMRQEDGTPWDGCPRTRLENMVDNLAAAGLSAQVGMEPEFTLLMPDGEGEYKPIANDGMYTVDGLDRTYDFLQNLVEILEQMGIQVTQIGKEYGPGQYEGNFQHASPIRAVDDYLIYRQVVRALARDAGMIATFMPKPYAHFAGNGLHVHLSLWDKAGETDLTYSTDNEEVLSEVGKHFMGGLLTHAPALTGVGACIVNSYKRLQPASWAPAHICWDVGNRAALVRVPGPGKRRHLEFRSGDNSTNPYFYVTALLAAGLDGIQRQLDPGPPANTDVGHSSAEELAAAGIQFLPRTLPEALHAVEQDKVIMDALGPIIGPEFLKVKRTELATYDLEVHSWERKTYLEAL